MKPAPLLKRLKRNKCIKWILQPFNFGLAATILYVGIIALESGLVGKWAIDIEKGKLNSLGDFLAGLFAPVAFFWLIITVSLQKEELALTRKEMIEQRKALRDQANEARAHKEFVEQQTKIMKQQADLSAITYHKNMKLQMFDKRMDVYGEIKKFTEKPFEELITNKENINFIHLMNKTMFLFAGSDKIIDWMGELSYVVFQTTNGDDLAEVRRNWQHLINPDQFHHLFFEHLTIYE